MAVILGEHCNWLGLWGRSVPARHWSHVPDACPSVLQILLQVLYTSHHYGTCSLSPTPVRLLTTFYYEQGIFLASAISYSPLTYEDKTPYPWWGEMLGWFLALTSMLQVPLVAAYLIWKEKGSFAERVETLLQPKVTLFQSVFLNNTFKSIQIPAHVYR